MAKSKHKKYDEAVKNYTQKQLQQAKDSAKQYYLDKEGIVSVKVLARIAKVPQGYIRKWIKEWENLVKEDPKDKVSLSQDTKKFLRTAAEEHGLDEQEELFCYHYLKTFNATTSAIRAGYSSSYAHNKAYRLLQDEKVQMFIAHVKEQRNSELFIDSMRIIKEYMKIAFADMTDFVRFGPNGIILRSSEVVDGQLIVKIQEGRNGLSLELADKMKALEKLEQYLGVMPDDTFKRRIEEEKLALQKERLEMDRSKNKSDTTNEEKVGQYIDLLTQALAGDGNG